MCKLWDQLKSKIYFSYAIDTNRLEGRFLLLTNVTVFDYQSNRNTNRKMQCNLLCLIINLLLFYEQRQIVFANQNDNDTKNDDELLGHLTTIGSVDLDVEPESTEQVPQPTPKTLNQLNG